MAATVAGATLRRGNEEGPLTTGALVFTADTISAGGYRWKVYNSPIGPAPLLNPVTQPKAVAAKEIEQAGARAGVHVNAGPAIGRTGRLPLRGLTYTAIVTARDADPAWWAANLAIVDGAGPGRIYDGQRWVDIVRDGDYSHHTVEQMSRFSYPQGLPDFEANEVLDVATRLIDAEASAAVQEVLAELDTTPPGPTEEAEGVVAREAMVWMRTVGEAEQSSIALSTDFDRERRREIAFAMRHAGIDLATACSLSTSELASITHAAREAGGVDLAAGKGDQTVAQDYEIQDGVLNRVGEPRVLDPAYLGEVSRQYAQAFDAGQTAVSALSVVLGDGQPDLPPAPVDTRPWMPTGDLVVVVARGELRQTIRLDCAPVARIGAHKDAEVRLLGAHTIAATLLQQDGAVWVCRGSDNVAVDLLGLDIRETVRLREGAEVQIGSMYTLTITSAATS